MNQAAVVVKNLNKSFGEDHSRLHVLKDINISFDYGKVSMLVGPSGCGKTTLISIIGAILSADNGDVDVLNKQIHLMNPDEKTEFRKLNIGYIFQQFNLISTLTVEENVAIPLLANNVAFTKALRKAREYLDIMGIADKSKIRPNTLSGGEQQRVAIARSLVHDPKLIICDEPTASLDGQTGQKVVELIKNTASTPEKAVIIVTHDNRIFKYGDVMMNMEDGRIMSVQKVDPEAYK
jgi:putative ABC transport system ATP-binding protein